MFLAQSSYDSPMMTIAMFSFFAVVVYVMPTIIAMARRHHKNRLIILLNILAGWTIIGWIGALVWSLMPVETDYQTKRKKHLQNLQK